ncbi:hypothetical protein VTK73DRAFT_2442 [Phialemonium thermophilum]|uniref:Uncharacterized protein n=1 Tax=Phialemonium thermophilum TaxID=223376 RepID=A0ABR3VS58_9PEZI
MDGPHTPSRHADYALPSYDDVEDPMRATTPTHGAGVRLLTSLDEPVSETRQYVLPSVLIPPRLSLWEGSVSHDDCVPEPVKQKRLQPSPHSPAAAAAAAAAAAPSSATSWKARSPQRRKPLPHGSYEIQHQPDGPLLRPARGKKGARPIPCCWLRGCGRPEEVFERPQLCKSRRCCRSARF